ncbi:S-layer homology domain-containing protein, partial [Clostridiales bacterium COT073_COT-073]
EGSESYLEVTYQFPALPADIKKISKVEVNGILPPELGQQAIVSTTGLTVGSEYDIKKLAWEDANGKELEAGELFQENQTYTIIIDLAAKDGYQFEESANMYGKVNHKPAESLTPLHDNKSNHLSYTFPKLGNLTPPTDFLDVKTSDWVYPNVQSDFLDVKASNWFYPNVQYVVSRGIMNGIGNNMFDPNGKMTRAMIVTMVYRIDGAPSVSGSQDFKDNIEGQWFTDAVRWTYQKELAADFLG